LHKKDIDDAEILKQIPLNQVGKPEDIAYAALFLAAQESSYITGQVIGVNGGMYI
jgi:3-oxoacyl-[acyl-carrier protein] reductase